MESNRQSAEQWDQLVPIADYLLHFGLNPDLALVIKQELIAQWQYECALLLGCSGGEIQRILQSDTCAHWVGVDYSQTMLTMAANDDCIAKNHFIAADAAKLPFKQNSIDLIVIATGIIDHIDDRGAINILNQCHQISQPNGQLVLCHHHYPRPLLKQLWWLGACRQQILYQQPLNRWFKVASYIRKVLGRLTEKATLFNLGKDLELLCQERQLDFKQIIACLPSKHYVRSVNTIQQLANQAGWHLSPTNLDSETLHVLSGTKRGV
ncbi:class I SAM-dependent methyltransferase [Spartinivicinus ruber]|uniref:class I SAM-dependent methyltransferase n=1 Tax=Spartinivicinus ruber TaxID=2683272 RepID=UPI0013D094C5|nr:class I SAM-dependent methyltransferase [Spartinivicinus ruber]